MIDGASQRTVVGAGAELAVIEAGDRDRPTLLFIHGWPDTKALWEPMLAQLCERFHVVAYDVRGAGASSAPRGLAAYDYERLADDTASVIAAVSPGRPVHVVGHDWGGLQGWELATQPRFAGQLASLTSIAGPSLDQIGCAFRRLAWPPTPAGLLQLASRLRRSWYILVLLTPGGPSLLWRGLLGGGRWRLLLEHIERVPTGEGYPVRTYARDAMRGARLYRRNMPRRLLRPRRNTRVHVPVQLIVPTQDHLISAGYYEGAEQAAPGLRRRTIEGTHWAPRKHPELLARWIAEFVDDVEAGRVETLRVEAPRV